MSSRKQSRQGRPRRRVARVARSLWLIQGDEEDLEDSVWTRPRLQTPLMWKHCEVGEENQQTHAVPP